MVRTCSPNHVKKEVLIDQLVQFCADRKSLECLSKNEIVWIAFDCGFISEDERDASLVLNVSTIPCYLYTHIHDEKIRSQIEKYVKAYSLLYARGTHLVNLIVMSTPLPPFTSGTFPSELIQLPHILSKGEIVKKCFYPERWLNRKENNDDIDPSIKNVFEENRHLLDPLLPSDKVMANCGWDNPLNHMGDVFLGNVHVQIITPLESRLKSFILKKNGYNEHTSAKEVMKTTLYVFRPSNAIHIDDFEWATRFRSFLGIENHSSFAYAPLKEVDSRTWTLHVWLQTVMEDKFSRLPVATINRKFAYLDAKTVNYLLPTKTKNEMLEQTKNHVGTELQKLLGLTSKMFNKRRSIIRKTMRKKYSDKNNKFYKKWRKQGHSCLSSKAQVVSISTDGVGLRLALKTLPKKQSQGVEKKIPKDAFKSAMDTGRSNLLASTDENNVTHLVKRRRYYDAIRDKQVKKWEKSRMVGTAWGEALNKLSEAGGFKHPDPIIWKATLMSLCTNINVVKNEQLELKQRALHKMMRLRAKKRFQDRSWKQIIKPVIGTKKHIVLGIGDGDFPCTGKGEKAVPVKGIYGALRRVIRMMGMQRRVHTLSINEDNSTKSCHRCGHVQQKIFYSKHNKVTNVMEKKEVLRYRLCTNCSTIGKRRNRDVNASKNMLTLLNCSIHGLERPKYLCCPWKQYEKTSTEEDPSI